MPSVPLSELRPQIETEFGLSVEEIFAEIHQEPMAAGSIAQVHRAQLHSGEDVVVTIRRPGILNILETEEPAQKQ